MKVIPYELFKTTSTAEKRIHTTLKRVITGSNDVALHSLNIAKHQYKRWSEADFIIVGKSGIYLLEVKGGRITCENGIWIFTNRYGERNRKRESPWEQAKTAFFALESNYLSQNFKDELHSVPMGCGVVFTDMAPFLENNVPECPREIAAFSDDCKTPESFKHYLDRLHEYWAPKSISGNKNRKIKAIEPSLVGDILQFLRPNFEVTEPLGNQINDLEEEQIALTDGQYKIIDAANDNDRIIITGGAGSGKTFVAMATARNDAAANKSVLLTTRSRFLAAFLRGTKDIPDNLTILSFSEIEPLKMTTKFDALVIDEGQDLMQMTSIEILDELLIGGIDAGRWRWFGDPNHQVSPNFSFEQDAFLYLQSVSATKIKLPRNVRNTPKIVDRIKIFTQIDMEDADIRGSGGTFNFREANSEGEEKEKILQEMGDWLRSSSNVTRDNICILTSSNTNVLRLVEFLNENGLRAEPLSEDSVGSVRDAITVSTIENFKGLERSIVCIVGLGNIHNQSDLRRYIYQGLSRAIHTITIISSKQEKDALTGLIEKVWED